jgi:hypothetical protein
MFFAFLALFPSLVESERFCLSCGNQVCSNVMCEMLCVYLYDFLLRVQSQYDCIFDLNAHFIYVSFLLSFNY